MTAIAARPSFSLEFLLTCLLRGMTEIADAVKKALADFYSHASCEAWQRRAGSKGAVGDFYSHASCEAWLQSQNIYSFISQFLLTCLLRGMTFARTKHKVIYADFYSHASCEAWRWFFVNTIGFTNFYSHASCEAWHINTNCCVDATEFLLTCLLRGMTERDEFTNYFANFYSHASCEAWLSWRQIDVRCIKFLLTCLLRGMTERIFTLRCSFRFLLTCLLRGMTSTISVKSITEKFLLTCLLRGMTYVNLLHYAFLSISTHMPLARHDLCHNVSFRLTDISTHMPLARHDGISFSVMPSAFKFLLTCLLRGMTQVVYMYHFMQ